MGSPFRALVTAYKPSFLVCTPAVSFDSEALPESEDFNPLIFFPGVDFGSEHDCDALPILMQSLLGSRTGLAVDVGASEGMCSLLLLAHGHRLISYDYDDFSREWQAMS